ncbi:MAG: UDP-N-acetylmuramoyl-L-alanine--D-glutamate ligase [Clostridia bacterium]|nr:UDP-N-acetylmuramoyl-L-alanine--D-glutamate ligase [Clostridia bacterium]
MNFCEYKKSMENKRVCVIGIGVSNLPLIKLLARWGAKVTALDKRNETQLGTDYTDLACLGVSFGLGEDYLSKIPEDTEVLFKTPGIRVDEPEILKAKENGAVITSEMELFFDFCPCPIIAITGSDGKTTTTTLVSEFLKADGKTVYLGGNIGMPLVSELDNIKADDKVVLELSSFQLHTLRKSAEISLVTNITPNHLNWHTDYKEYIDSKKNIFAFQDNNGVTVLNYDNDITRSFAKEAKNPVFFSILENLADGYCLDGKDLVKKKNGEIVERYFSYEDIFIPGMHNVENYLAAIAATDGIVSKDVFHHVAKNFKGVPHRIEKVRELDGVIYYNDSIASSPARTIAGLKSFDKKVILIAGGEDKKIPYDEFGVELNNRIKKLVLVGRTSKVIYDGVVNAKNYNGLEIHKIEGISKDAFREAVEYAKKIAEDGDIVLLSPASTSFDIFKNFEERGNFFKEVVNSL